ncbi:MAG: ATP-binding protein [bacterium]|nr:ATP-binding protein [bacterium]
MRRANRLWVRLSLVFSLVIGVGVILFILLPRLVFDGTFAPNTWAIRLQAQDRLVEELTALYEDTGNWREAISLLREFDIILPRGIGEPPLTLVFADADGRIIYDGFDIREGIPLTDAERAEAIPVPLYGETRGYLLLQPIDAAQLNADPNFLARGLLNILVPFSLMIGVLSVIAGAIVSRYLTAPLSALAETVRAFGKPNMNLRAPVRGTVEVRDVATAFNEMADALVQAESLRRSLVADVAHELRTPLSVLQANLQALLDGVYPLDKNEIENLQTQTDLLRRLIDDLHELAQAEAHQLPLHFASVELNHLLEGVVERFEAVVAQHDLWLHLNLPDEPLSVNADPDRLAQVLHNLLQNAVAHTQRGGITLALYSREDVVQIEVRDTGSGIPPEDQTRIFERFYRTDQSRSRATGGAGLGLAIARAIVEMHDGTISVSSLGAEGFGTTFTVTLPLERQGDLVRDRLAVTV